MKKVLKLLLIIVILTYSVSCAIEEEITNDKAREILTDVANSNQRFNDVYGNEVLFKNYNIANEKVHAEKYTFIDLDGDKVDELILYLTNEHASYLILHHDGKKIYGYLMDSNDFEGVKKDGTFRSTDSDDTHKYMRLTFQKNLITTYVLAINDEENGIYQINGMDVSKTTIDKYVEKWNKKENSTWEICNY